MEMEIEMEIIDKKRSKQASVTKPLLMEHSVHLRAHFLVRRLPAQYTVLVHVRARRWS